MSGNTCRPTYTYAFSIHCAPWKVKLWKPCAQSPLAQRFEKTAVIFHTFARKSPENGRKKDESRLACCFLITWSVNSQSFINEYFRGKRKWNSLLTHWEKRDIILLTYRERRRWKMQNRISGRLCICWHCCTGWRAESIQPARHETYAHTY